MMCGESKCDILERVSNTYSNALNSSPYSHAVCITCKNALTMGRRPLPAVRDFTRDVRRSTYLRCKCTQENVGNMRRDRLPSKATITNKSMTNLARLGHFPCRPGVLCICLSSHHRNDRNYTVRGGRMGPPVQPVKVVDYRTFLSLLRTMFT
jgi:hypothetical protein